MKGFEIWAAVDVLNGQCVQLRGGDPGAARFIQDPVGAAQRWAAEGADGLHVVDLDAALGHGHNRSVIERLLKSVRFPVPVPVQVGGGVRDAQTAERWLARGAARVVVGTRGVQDPGWLRGLAERFPRRVVLALDARGDEVVIQGWQRRSGRRLLEVAQAVEELGVELAAFLYTDVDREGSLQGLDPEPLRALCASVRTPVLVAGGLRSAEDAQRARELGASGAVLGTALYAGTVRLPELKAQLQRSRRMRR